MLIISRSKSRRGRVPCRCPRGFKGRYTVVRGDTMYFIAKRYGIRLQSLIKANPHITNPNLIYPGDILCVPSCKKRKRCKEPEE